MLKTKGKIMDARLAAWIARDQEERRQHALYMARKNEKDDKLWNKMIVELFRTYGAKLKANDKLILLNFARHKKDGKNFTPAQRSVITNLYYKYEEA
jgi:hypothetical protein